MVERVSVSSNFVSAEKLFGGVYHEISRSFVTESRFTEEN